MTHEEPGFNFWIWITYVPLTRILVRKNSLGLFGRLGTTSAAEQGCLIENQVVLFEAMLVIATRVALISVQLAIHKDKLVTGREQVTLGAHSKAYLGVVIHLAWPEAVPVRLRSSLCWRFCLRRGHLPCLWGLLFLRNWGRYICFHWVDALIVGILSNIFFYLAWLRVGVLSLGLPARMMGLCTNYGQWGGA